MFFQGTLQEGIAAALQQTKSVVCFVTDSGDESQQWEEDYLPNSEASSLIESQAILLRLEAGSQEEGFLTQLYPIPKKPTVIIIKNGELKEYIAAGVTKDDFVRRVKAVLQPMVPPTATPAQPEQAPAPSPTPQAVPRTEVSSTSGSSGQDTPSSESQTRSVADEQPTRTPNAHNRSTSTPNTKTTNTSTQHHTEEKPAESTTSSKEAQVKQAELVKKKQREAREERQRILKAIEDDKIARQARKAELEAERLAAAAAASGEETKDSASTTAASASTSKPRSSNGRLSETCAIQVRLLDGSTIRNRFSSTADTVQSVRKWVDETRTDGKTPYNFKILLTPLPSKAILATEEKQSLRELKLAPSATLILVPAAGKKYTRPQASASASANSGSSSSATVTNDDPDDGDVYEGGGGNPFIQLINFLLGIINGFFGLIASFFTTLFSTAGPPQPVDQPSQPGQQRPQASSATTTGRAGGGSRIKGLERERRPEKRNDQQFYNGNSTNFEPRPDDKDE
ncbi:UBX domain containing protein [Naviculisporaceae sp. PSN 640]